MNTAHTHWNILRACAQLRNSHDSCCVICSLASRFVRAYALHHLIRAAEIYSGTWLTLKGGHRQVEGLIPLWLQGGPLGMQRHCCNGPVCLICCHAIKPAHMCWVGGSLPWPTAYHQVHCSMSKTQMMMYATKSRRIADAVRMAGPESRDTLIKLAC